MVAESLVENEVVAEAAAEPSDYGIPGGQGMVGDGNPVAQPGTVSDSNYSTSTAAVAVVGVVDGVDIVSDDVASRCCCYGAVGHHYCCYLYRHCLSCSASCYSWHYVPVHRHCSTSRDCS